MGRVASNSFGLAAVRETALNTPGNKGWFELEPNGSPTIQASITTIARNPISPDRQRKKGTISDLTASVTFDHDLTMDLANEFFESFLFTTATNKDMDLASTAVAKHGTFDSWGVFTVDAVAANQVTRFAYGPRFSGLFYGAGFNSLSNDGLWEMRAAVAANDTTLTLGRLRMLQPDSPDSVAETGSTGILYRAGVALNGGAVANARTSKSGAYSSGTRLYTLTTSDGPDWTAMGLTAGETVSLNGHYGRVVSTTATTLVLEQTDAGLQNFSPADDDEVLVLYGKYLRNVGIDHADYEETTYHVEGAYPGLGDGSTDPIRSVATGYEYARGSFPNQVTLNVPLAEKVTANLAFVATDVMPPTIVRLPAAAASTIRAVDRGTAYSSTSDVGRMRVTELDEDGISTFFKSLTLTINNNSTEEKIVGKLGAEFLTPGDFHVDLETTVLFTNGRVLSAIRNNETTALQIILGNDNGSLVFDVPAMTLGGGAKDLPENQAITLALTGAAFPHPVNDNSIGISIHPFRQVPSA